MLGLPAHLQKRLYFPAKYRYRTDFGTLWEKARVGWSERIALKHVYYQGWNRSPVQVGCMRQVLRAGALGWPRGMGWGGRWEGVSGWGTHVNPWLIHVNVWQKPLQYCKVISLQLIKIKRKIIINTKRLKKRSDVFMKHSILTTIKQASLHHLKEKKKRFKLHGRGF